MKNVNIPLFPAILVLLSIGKTMAQAPVINGLTPNTTTVEQYDKFEVKVNLTANYTNPYDYANIRVFAVFTAPDGTTHTVEGFYMESFTLNTNNGLLSPFAADNGFRIRFAPTQVGNWNYTVSCTTAAGTGTYPAQSFDCYALLSTVNKGFVKSGPSNYLKFDNGEQYIPVGENIAWQNANPYLDYKNWVGDMADNGGNFLRLWLCHWGIGLEWKNNVSGFAGLKRYKQVSAYYMDWLFDYCADEGVYVMLCLNHHGQVSSQVNPNWAESPYNASNGGPCANTWDFFTNATAKDLHKNRLHYILARWGYARSIMCWELFNEVNWTDNFDQHQTDISAWHAEMAAFLKSNDPNIRPVSSSFGNPQSEIENLWNNPDMDFSQRHYYFDSPNTEAVLAAGIQDNLALYDKPALIGEFGLGNPGNELLPLDPDGIHIHNGLWGGLFGGGLGSAMSWWWDSYIEPADLYHHFDGVSSIARKVALESRDFRPAPATIANAPADLRLDAALDWGGLGDTLIAISAAGVVSPDNYGLCRYLYGALWNTQYRRPPVFVADMPQAGKFRVRTGSQLATAPKLAVWLDGQKVLDVVPAVNTLYEINVPAGLHTLKVDNTGTDWMQVAYYAFSGLGTAVDAYLLKSADNTRLTGWLLNKNYNHVYVKANGEPDAISGAVLNAGNLADGNYYLNWFDCQTGALNSFAPVSVQNGQLSVPIPDLLWDAAFVLDVTPVSTQNEKVQSLAFSVFPNAASAGQTLHVSFDLPAAEAVDITLYDAGGLPVQRLFSGGVEPGSRVLPFLLNDVLPAGLYWVGVKAGARRGMKAVGVMRG